MSKAMNKPRETPITRSILTYLNSLAPDCWARKIHCSAMQGAGIPDILACYRGRFIAIEVKRPGNKATALQADTLDKLMAAGGVSVVVHSLGDVRAVIGILDKQREVEQE